MNPFGVDDDRIGQLRSTRQGRASAQGFEYQAAYAVARLASLDARAPLLGMKDVPTCVRYDWAEDLDEVSSDGSFVFTQCKRLALDASRLSQIIISFIPKLLFVEDQTRDRTKFRVVSPTIGIKLQDYRATVEKQAMSKLLAKPHPSSDQTRWIADCQAYGLERAIDDVWAALEHESVEDAQDTRGPVGPLYYIERIGLDLLLAQRRVSPDWQQEALDALRRLVRIEPNDWPKNSTPPAIEPADVRASLLRFGPKGPTAVPFIPVGREYIAAQRAKPKMPFVATPPTWADVVHGPDNLVKYVTRDQEEEITAAIDRHLLDPLLRGTDQRLHALFLIGPPGAGKTTLARRVLIDLIERGRVVVADLGVNQGGLDRDEVDTYLAPLAALTTEGRPVILLMDDPFFAASHWDLLLERLSRPSFQGVAVLGASPSYLYGTYGRRLAGKQLNMLTIEVNPASPREQHDLVQTFSNSSAREQSAAEGRDFLVAAMEAATGSDFAAVVQRIWITLNDGVAISARARPRELPWTVRAFMIAAYFARFDVTCSEGLLREALSQADADAGDLSDNIGRYIDELGELKFANGWHIFKVDGSDSGQRRISISHTRIAQEAWRYRPRRDFDLADWIVPASVRAPTAAHELAQLIVTCQALSIEPADQRLHERLAQAWADNKVPLTLLVELVEGLLLARGRAKHFRPALRAALKVADERSWLAAVELRKLARYGSLERQALDSNLRILLRKADLSIDPFAAADLLRGKEYRTEVEGRIIAALRRETPWMPTSELVAELIRVAPHTVNPSFDSFLEWFDSTDPSLRAWQSLLKWYQNHCTEITPAQQTDLLSEAISWLEYSDDEAAVHALLGTVERADSIPGASVDLALRAVFDWVVLHPLSHNALGNLLADVRSQRETVAISVDRLAQHTRHWLSANYEDNYVRHIFLRFVRRFAESGEIPTVEIATEAWEWLERHPYAHDVRGAFLRLMHVPIMHVTYEIVAETRSLLTQGIANELVRSSLLDLLRVRRSDVEAEVVGAILVETREWLRSHSQSVHVWRALFALVRDGDEQSSGAFELATEWLKADPDDSTAWLQYLGLLDHYRDTIGNSAHPIVEGVWSWVLSHPADTAVLSALLACQMRHQGSLPLDRVTVFNEAWLRLRRKPDETQIRIVLIAALPLLLEASAVVPAEELVEDTRGWLAIHPNEKGTRAALAGSLDALWALRTIPAESIAEELTEWANLHARDQTVRQALNAMYRRRAVADQAESA